MCFDKSFPRQWNIIVNINNKLNSLETRAADLTEEHRVDTYLLSCCSNETPVGGHGHGSKMIASTEDNFCSKQLRSVEDSSLGGNLSPGLDFHAFLKNVRSSGKTVGNNR